LGSARNSAQKSLYIQDVPSLKVRHKYY